MSQTSYEGLRHLLKSAAPGGVYFLHGEEAHLREEALRCVVQAHLDPASRDFNLDQVRGSEVTPETLASLLATPPMMAEWRVVVVRDAQGLSPKAREVVEGVLRSPPSGLALVISARIPDRSQAKFYRRLIQEAASVEFPLLDALDAPGWLMERAAAVHGVQLQAEAARVLVAAVGTDLGTLSSELEKLADGAGENRPIGEEDVRSLVGEIPRQDRWEWFDLVGERRFGEALRSLPALLEGGESGVGLVIGMTTQLLRIALVCAGGRATLERELKPYQRWLARRIVPQARHWSLPEVDDALAELLRADHLLKSAPLSEQQVLEELLLRLRTTTRAGAAA